MILGDWSSDVCSSDLCVMGFRTASCSEWRDFQLILAVGVLFYCAMLLALSIFYNVKELRGIKREGENE